MHFVGVDLHKKVIRLCVIRVVRGKREIARRARFACRDTAGIRAFFEELGRFRAVVEATAGYEWFFLLIEDLADRLVLAHPKKLRVIAESTRKTDKIDAEVLAVFLALDMIPEAYRPSPRIRQYRVLARHRRWLSSRMTAIKAKLRNKLAHYNADIAELFTRRGQAYLADLALNAADRFETVALQEQLMLFQRQLIDVDAELRTFALTAPLAEREARAILASIPLVGPVTIDVVLSELGDWRRFRGARAVVAFAGLAPGVRESAGKRHDLSITKEGSRLLRWALIQAAWRLKNQQPRWGRLYDQLFKKTGSKKKAIVAVARHLLCVMFSMLQSGRAYRLAA
ncbi:MAG: IS110 family transposase [Pirellulaceae bacterium]|nr:IS110 family transposase [Pirellulaceae bacterium]